MGIFKWLLGAIATLVALYLALYGVGLALPRGHSAHAERTIASSAAILAAQIRDVQNYPEWREGVEVSVATQTPQLTSYFETIDGERIAYTLTEPEHDARFVISITDQSLPFGGQWTIALTPQNTHTIVRIVEDGEIRDPLYRVFAHFVFGYTSTMETYLDSLEASAA